MQVCISLSPTSTWSLKVSHGMNSPAFTFYATFDKSWTVSEPYRLDQVQLKAEVG